MTAVTAVSDPAEQPQTRGRRPVDCRDEVGLPEATRSDGVPGGGVPR